MRQAGRFLPQFRAIRARKSFLELCKDSALACEVTLMPVELLKVDAAIIFADILLPLDALGTGLSYPQGEGPLIAHPVAGAADVAQLADDLPAGSLSYVFDAIALTRRALPHDIPLLGFAGAPFTMACYLIEGGGTKTFEKTKRFMHNEPQSWHALMGKLATVTGSYLAAQVRAGADALQIFDSWVGCLSPSDYDRFVLPYTKQVFDTIGDAVPLIHFGTGTAGLLPNMVQAGGSVIGVDWRVPLDAAWRIIGPDKAVQGNLDPCVLLAGKDEIRRQALRVLGEAGGRPGHIFNLGHGVLPPTDPENVRYLVELIHEQELVRQDG